MGWLDKLIGKAEPDVIPEPAPATVVATNIQDGIHHEFFLDDEVINGRHGWLCRVYAPGGVMHQSSGSEETNQAAAQSAIAWAESTKADLRRKE